ncbi:MAG: DUF2341 domain-containing protein, partial [Planctomycetes bacterium]|nr:DUF2341 domain-containing protein [Planctomycetota bacterium]
NFPVLIRLDTTNFDFSEPLSTGYDIRFSKSDIDEHLSFERERWTITASDSIAEFWVRADTVYGDNSTQYIKMFWGKAGASDASSGSDVFKTDANYDFEGVWHLKDTEDATSNNNDVTLSAAGEPTVEAGLIGNAMDFDGDDYLSAGTGPSLNGTVSFTYSAWVRTAGAADAWFMCQRNGGFVGANRFHMNADGTIKWALYGSGGYQFD